MEDAATAEITRVQLWQWVRYGVRLAEDGVVINASYIDSLVKEVSKELVGPKSVVRGLKKEDVDIATQYLMAQVRQQWPSEFLTSDLMGWLAVRDGVEPKLAVRASL